MKKNYLAAGNGSFLSALLVLFTMAASAQSVTYLESFDGTTFVPAGWTEVAGTGTTADWTRVTTGGNPTQSPFSGAGQAKFNSYDAGTGESRTLITPPFSLANNTTGAAMSFYMYRDGGYSSSADKIDVSYNTVASVTGATLLGTVNRSSALSPTVASNGWYQYSFTIPSTVTNASVYLIFHATSAYGNNTYMDHVSWTSYPPACSGTPATPLVSASSASGCPGSGVTLNSTGGTTDAGITYQWEASNSATGTFSAIANATNASYAATGVAATSYFRLITTCANSALSSTSAVQGYTINNPGPCLCNNYGTNAATSTGDEDIWAVVFGSMNNVSTCSSVGPGPGSIQNRYSNYAGFVTAPQVCAGAAVPFTVNINTCGGWYGMNFNVYIDYNQNGVFTDAGELVHAKTSAVQGNNTGTITVPVSALAGVTRMRVVAVEGTVPGPSTNYTWGETEDYCVNILPPPAISLASNTGSVCPGISFTTTASGASTYSIVGGAGSVAGSNITLSPLVTTNYTITGTDATGCVAPASIGATATVNTLSSPDITITPSPAAICAGETATLTAAGATTYTWNTSSNSTMVTVAPAVTTVYTVSGTGTTVCNGVKTYTLVVNQLPVITVNSGTLCEGGNYTLTPSGAATYTYSGGTSVVSPSVNTSYSVTGTSSAGCISGAAAVAEVTVVALPVVSVNSGSICAGQPYYVMPTGAASYSLWGFSNPVLPSSSTSYSVTGTASTGCVSLPAVANVTVHQLPNVAINAPTLSCAGETFTMTASGASGYTWSTGSNQTSITQSPTANISYYVIGVDSNGCSQAANISVSVNPVPPLTLSSTSTLLCTGQSAMLTANGAVGGYTWSTGANTNTIGVSPATSTVYNVTGINNVSCTATRSISIQVNTIVVTMPANTAVCAGKSATLSVTGANTHTWSFNNSPFNSIIVTPTIATMYTVGATDANKCLHTASVTVTINSNPPVTASASQPTMCTNESLTLTASGADTYSWSNGLSGAEVVLTPTVNLTFKYTVYGVDANGCQGTATVSVIVDRCVGVAEVLAAKVAVFPNPGAGMFRVNVEGGTNLTLQVTDVAGRILLEQQLNSDGSDIDLRNHANGLYYLRMISGSAAETVKLIKQ